MCEQQFVIHSNHYYDELLRDLDDRRTQHPVSVEVVPSLDLRMFGRSSRISFGGSLTSRPGTGRFVSGHPFTSRTSSDQVIERERRRADLMYARDINLAFKSRRGNAAMMKLNDSCLRRKELEIENSLLDPYRHNEDRANALVARVRTSQRIKKALLLETQQRKHSDTFSDPTVVNYTEKVAQVIQRRTTILQERDLSLRRNAVLWQEKIEQHAAQQTQEESSYARQKKWLELLTVVNKMQLMGRVVAHVRAVRARDVTKWRAVTVIQRYWRKFCPSKRGAVKESFIVNLRKTMGAAAGAKLLQYQARVNACTVLISFLRNKGFKVAVLQFIWKVKQLQRKFRAHLSSNKFRVDVLSRCLDLCGPSLALHIHIVHAGRGFDLRNLTTYENDQMKRLLQDGRNHRLVRQMQTPAFHACLRANIQKFALLLRESTNTILSFNRAAVDSAVRRPLLLDVVFRKRRQYSLLFNSQMRLEINIPKVNVEDARSFVHGGADPVSSFLEAVARKEGDLVSNYQQRRRKAKEAAAESGADCKLANNTMLFLHAVKVEEVASWALSIAEKACLYLQSPQGMRQMNAGYRRMTAVLPQPQAPSEPSPSFHEGVSGARRSLIASSRPSHALQEQRATCDMSVEERVDEEEEEVSDPAATAAAGVNHARVSVAHFPHKPAKEAPSFSAPNRRSSVHRRQSNVLIR